MATLADLLGRLDSDPVRRGKQFERITKWFLTHDPVYARELRHVWLWDEWPGAWGAEAGIDLVAEDHNGDLWAIQAKCYAPTTSITKRQVDTFLSESGRAEFKFRLLIATTDLIGHNARRTIDALDASVLLRGDLEARDVDWPASRSAPTRPSPSSATIPWWRTPASWGSRSRPTRRRSRRSWAGADLASCSPPTSHPRRSPRRSRAGPDRRARRRRAEARCRLVRRPDRPG